MQITIDKHIVNYQYLNTYKSKTIIILHGWKSNMNQWGLVAQMLSNTANIITLDLPGFGQSSKPNSVWEIYDYANFIEKFLKKLEIDRCIVMGHSFGGRIALILASRKNSFELEKLILVDSAGIENSFLSSRIRNFVIRILSKSIVQLLPASIRFKIKKHISSEDYKSAGEMVDILKKAVNLNLRPVLKKINVPTLIIWGSNDQVLNIKQAKVLHSEIPGSKLRIIWGAGHRPHTDKQDELIDVLNEYIC